MDLNKTIMCPKCGSKNIYIDKKGFSTGKAIAGGLLTGNIFIKWPAVMINNSEHPYLKVWENTRGTKTNVLILHEAENYLVILRKGNGYVILWTAYLIEYESRKRKLLKEYGEFIKSKERWNTAPVSPSTHGR